MGVRGRGWQAKRNLKIALALSENGTAEERRLAQALINKSTANINKPAVSSVGAASFGAKLTQYRTKHPILDNKSFLKTEQNPDSNILCVSVTPPTSKKKAAAISTTEMQNELKKITGSVDIGKTTGFIFDYSYTKHLASEIARELRLTQNSKGIQVIAVNPAENKHGLGLTKASSKAEALEILAWEKTPLNDQSSRPDLQVLNIRNRPYYGCKEIVFSSNKELTTVRELLKADLETLTKQFSGEPILLSIDRKVLDQDTVTQLYEFSMHCKQFSTALKSYLFGINNRNLNIGSTQLAIYSSKRSALDKLKQLSDQPTIAPPKNGWQVLLPTYHDDLDALEVTAIDHSAVTDVTEHQLFDLKVDLQQLSNNFIKADWSGPKNIVFNLGDQPIDLDIRRQILSILKFRLENIDRHVFVQSKHAVNEENFEAYGITVEPCKQAIEQAIKYPISLPCTGFKYINLRYVPNSNGGVIVSFKYEDDLKLEAHGNTWPDITGEFDLIAKSKIQKLALNLEHIQISEITAQYAQSCAMSLIKKDHTVVFVAQDHNTRELLKETSGGVKFYTYKNIYEAKLHLENDLKAPERSWEVLTLYECAEDPEAVIVEFHDNSLGEYLFSAREFVPFGDTDLEYDCFKAELSKVSELKKKIIIQLPHTVDLSGPGVKQILSLLRTIEEQLLEKDGGLALLVPFKTSLTSFHGTEYQYLPLCKTVKEAHIELG